MALPDSSLSSARNRLRAELRARRALIAPAARARASRRVALEAVGALRLRAGARIAVYHALPEELDSAPLIALARQRGCHLYLPRIDRRRASRHMRFLALQGPLRTNRLGIAEPGDLAGVLPARWLDVVFLPLVGFDRSGLRLGTGGGFYDRAFAFRRWRLAWHKPLLVGLAYAIQEVGHIVPAAHDVRMDAVVTEGGIIRCATG